MKSLADMLVTHAAGQWFQIVAGQRTNLVLWNSQALNPRQTWILCAKTWNKKFMVEYPQIYWVETDCHGWINQTSYIAV